MPTNPGSSDAKRLGCTCPVLDNAYGKGAVVDGQILEAFYVDPDCPIHLNQALVRVEVPRGEVGAEADGSEVVEGRSDTSDTPDPSTARGSEGGDAGVSARFWDEFRQLHGAGSEA